MPDTTYAIAVALGMASLGLAFMLFWVRGAMPAAKRRKATALWAAWVLAAMAAELWALVGPGWVPIVACGLWAATGLALGRGFWRAGRAARAKLALPQGLAAPLPAEAVEALGRLGVGRDDVLASVATDVRLDGLYGRGLVAVTRERLVALALAEARAEVLSDISLAAVEQVRAESVVGGGRLVVRLPAVRHGRSRAAGPPSAGARDGADLTGPPEVLARYSNAQGRSFAALAKKLDDHASARRAYDKACREGVADAEPPGELTFKDDDGDKIEQRTCPKCGRSLPEGSEVCPACVKRARAVVRLLGLSAGYWKQIAALMSLMVLGTVVGLVPLWLPGKLVGEVFSSEVLAGSREAKVLWVSGTPQKMLLILAAVYMASTVLGVAINIVRGRLAVVVGARVGMELRAKVFHHLQTLSLGYFDKQKTGALMSRTDNDTRQVQFFLIDGVQMTVLSLLEVVGISAYLFYRDWRLAVWVMLPAPLVIAGSALFWRIVFGMMRRLWERIARLSAFINDSISGVRVVKAFGQEEREKARFDRRNLDVCEGLVAMEQTWVTFQPLLHLLILGGFPVVWYVGGMGIIEKKIDVDTLVTFIMFLGRFYGPVMMLSRINDFLTRSLTAAERVFEVLDATPDVKEADDAVDVAEMLGAVEFKGVTFGYDKFKPVLKDVSFAVSPGEMIGFVGHSGAGKTTTINLICRLYDVDEGAVLFDDVDVRKLRLDSLRQRIGVVLQETYLFSGTVAENIAYASPEATPERVLDAAAAANAHDFIMQRADGYDSDVGERGGQLSTGEKQRIAIARAILHDPKVLILDEATSSVDTETEKQIQTALARLVRNRTTFAIAHRLSTLRNAHRLIVIEHGKVVEVGTHKELLDRRGIYYKLVKTQTDMSRTIAVGG